VHTPSKLSAIQFGDRFAFYAKRVHSISLGEYGIEKEDGNFIRLVIDPEVVSAWFMGDKVFPRLHRLIFYDEFLHNLRTVNNAALIKNILGTANLTSLQIWTRQGTVTVFEDNMEGLLSNCSGLEELALGVNSNDENNWENFLSTMLLHTTQLRFLYTTFPVSYTDLLWLANYRHLSTLKLQEVSRLPEGPLVLPSNSFRQLHHLTLRDHAPYRLACAVLAAVPSDGLIECDLYLHADVHTNPTHQDIHSVLHQVITHANLVGISVSIQGEADHPDLGSSLETSAMFFGLFHSLVKLKFLTFGCLFNQNMFPIDETIISNLTQACPRLQWWISSGYTSAQTVIPFISFLDILRYHPDLKALPTSVDASVLPDAGFIVEFGQHEYEQTLIIQYIEETAELEEVVAQLFPCVRMLSIQSPHQWQLPRYITMGTVPTDVTHSDSDA
jgi:hypothetical protein